MAKLVEIVLEDGKVAYVEAKGGSTLKVGSGEIEFAGGPGGVGERVRVAAEEAFGAVRPLTERLLRELDRIEGPRKVAVEFSLQFDAGAKAFVFSTDVSTAFKVTMEWQREEPAAGGG